MDEGMNLSSSFASITPGHCQSSSNATTSKISHVGKIVSTLTRTKPQTMFKDGLHLIYAYLKRGEWNSSIQTCHHWSTAAESEPTRNAELPLPLDGRFEMVGSGPSQSGPYRLHHHIRWIRPGFSGGEVTQINVEQLDHILTLLPSLCHIHAFLKPHPSTIYRPQLNWPHSLVYLSLYLDEVDSSDVIRSLSTITYLKTLSLINPSSTSDRSSYQSLASLINLERLMISMDWKRVDVLTLIGPYFPLSLTSLDLYRTPLQGLKRLYFPNIVEFNLLHISLHPGDLALIHHAMPNLKQLAPFEFHVEEFASLTLFQQLETIIFRENPVSPSLLDDVATMAVNGLIYCPSLTALIFKGSFTMRTVNHWSQIAQYLPKLTSLTFHDASDHLEALLPLASQLKRLRSEGLGRAEPPPVNPDQSAAERISGEVKRLRLSTLAQFIELEHVVVFQILDEDSLAKEVVEAIRRYFDDPLILPKLRYLEVIHLLNYDSTCLYDAGEPQVGVGIYRLPRSNSVGIE